MLECRLWMQSSSIILGPLAAIYCLVSYYQGHPIWEIALGLFGYLCGAVTGGLPALTVGISSSDNGPANLLGVIIKYFLIIVGAIVGICLNSFLMFVGIPLAAIAVDLIIPILLIIPKRDHLIKSFQKSEEERYEKELEKYKRDLKSNFLEAVKSGDVETVNSLIQSRMDFLKETVNKTATLQTAVKHGRIEVVKALIQAGTELRPWLLGCAPNENTARFLVEAGIDVNSRERNGSTALIEVSNTGHTDVVRFLIGAGADVNAQRDDGWTALMMASFKGHTDVVRFLIEAGADVNAQTDNGGIALMMASLSASDSIIKRLVAPESNKEVCYHVKIKGYVDVVQALIEAGADVNAKDKNGETALIYASTGEVAKILIEAGADINAKDENGETALMKATRKSRTGVVKVLIEAGADVNSPNKNGEIALKLATKTGDTETVNVLRKAGATATD